MTYSIKKSVRSYLVFGSLLNSDMWCCWASRDLPLSSVVIGFICQVLEVSLWVWMSRINTWSLEFLWVVHECITRIVTKNAGSVDHENSIQYKHTH